jgi:hypothetical protein
MAQPPNAGNNTMKLTLAESEVLSQGYDGGVNPHQVGSVLYHLFEAGKAVKAQEAQYGVWDEQNGVWIKG